MTVWIGTSGWQYRHWRGPFYPPEEPVRRWLELYAALTAAGFHAIEVPAFVVSEVC